jgi:hypothetical protein
MLAILAQPDDMSPNLMGLLYSHSDVAFPRSAVTAHRRYEQSDFYPLIPRYIHLIIHFRSRLYGTPS